MKVIIFSSLLLISAKAVCTPEYYDCPNGTIGFGTKQYANPSNCEIDYDGCCDNECPNGNIKSGFINENQNGIFCDYEANACSATTSSPTTTGCSNTKYICCNGYKKTECYVDQQNLTDTNGCTYQFEEYSSLETCTDKMTCPTDGTTMMTTINRNECCMFMEHECCQFECEEGYFSGYLYENLDGSTTCKYKDDNYNYIDTPCQPAENATTSTPCELPYYVCPDGTVNVGSKLTADSNCNIDYDFCCLDECPTHDLISGTYTTNGDGSYTCVYDEYNTCPTTTTEKPCDTPYYMCPDGTTLAGSKTYADEYCDIDYDFCCLKECPYGLPLYGTLDEDEYGTICVFDAECLNETTTTTPTTTPTTSTTETPCEDDGSTVCCAGSPIVGACIAEEECPGDWQPADKVVCIQSIFQCPEGAPVFGLSYSAYECCSIDKDDCCVRTCNNTDGTTSEMRGEYTTTAEGCVFEYEACGSCPEDARLCENGQSIVRNAACEFDLSDCCEERDGCVAIGYANEDLEGKISCEYECATTEEPMDEISTTEEPMDDETSTTEVGGGFSGAEMMNIMAGIVFVCGIFGWM